MKVNKEAVSFQHRRGSEGQPSYGAKLYRNMLKM